ncbi:MAG: type II secretion system protein GspD [Fervidobacterium nodosum]
MNRLIKYFIVFLVLVFFNTLLYSELLDVSYVTSTNEIVIVLSFSKAPNVLYYGKNESRTVHYFLIDDFAKGSIYLPISIGSTEGVQIVPIDGKVNAFVYTLTPGSVKYNTTGTKLYIRLPYSMSSKRLTASFANIKSDILIKDVAEFFGIKVVLYDGAKDKSVSIKLDNSSIEDVIRTILTAANLSYAYASDQVMYIGSKEEIQKNFAVFWQVYDAQVNVEKLREVLSAGSYLGLTRDKSKVFIYGGVNEYKMIAEALVPMKVQDWYYISYNVSDKDIEEALSQISKIYGFTTDDYVILKEQKKIAVKTSKPLEVENLLKQIMARIEQRKWYYIQYSISENDLSSLITSLQKIYDIKDFAILQSDKKLAILVDDASIVPQVEKIIKSAESKVAQLSVTYVPVDVNYPERVQAVLKEIYPNSNPKVVSGKLYVVSGYEKIALSLSKEPYIGNPWKIVIDDVPENVVISILKYIGVLENDFDMKTIENKVIVNLFSSEDTYKKFLKYVDVLGESTYIVKADENFLKKFKVTILQNFSDGTKLVQGRINEIERLKKSISEEITNFAIQKIPTDPPAEVISKLTGYVVEDKDKYFIVTVSKSEIETAKTTIEKVRKDYGNTMIILPDKYKSEAKKAVEDIYNVKIYQIGENIVLQGSLVDDAKKFLENFVQESENIVEILGKIEPNSSKMLGELFNVKLYQAGDVSYIVGTPSNVSKAKEYAKLIESVSVDLSFKIGQNHVDYLKKVYNVDVDYFPNIDKVVITGLKENTSKAASYLRSLTPSDSILSVKLPQNLKKEEIDKLTKLIASNVEIEQVGDALYIKGEIKDIEKIKQEIEKLSKTPERKYLLINYPDSFDSVIKALYSVETYKTSQGYIIFGTNEQIENVKKFLSENAVSDKSYTLLSYPEELDNLIKEYFNVKTYKVSQGFIVVGSKEEIDKVNKFIGELSLGQDKEYNLIDDKLLIDVSDKNIKDVIINVGRLFKQQIVLVDDIKSTCSMRTIVSNFQEFLDKLASYNITYELKNDTYYISMMKTQQSTTTANQVVNEEIKSEPVVVKDGLITINASNMSVDDIIIQVMIKLNKSYKLEKIGANINSMYLKDISYETFKEIFSAWVNFTEIGSITYITPKGVINNKTDSKKAFVKDGLINIKIDNEPISQVIQTIFEGLGYQVVFAKPIDKTATMSVSGIDFETFNSIMLNYGISIKKSGNVYIVDTTPEATKVRTTYTFNVPRNADKVEELIKFYGGKTMVSPSAGIIVAYDLDPKNVDDINKLIEKFAMPKIVSIDARIIDESRTGSLSEEIATLLKAGNYLTFGSNGLTLNVSILDILDGSIIDKILNEAGISLELRGAEQGTPFRATSGIGKLLANPNIMTKSGEEARIFIGDTIPLKIVTTNEGRTTVEIRNLEGGIELKIVPYVNADNTIDLVITTSVSNFDFSVNVDGLPKINKREASTKITIKDGQTLVIGGLSREEKSKTEWKVPILGDIPILGYLFRGTKETSEQRSITIFLTAKIVDIMKE